MSTIPIRKPYLVLFVLLIILAVFYGTIFAEILQVDDEQLFYNLFNLESWSLKEVFTPAGSGYYYRPLLGLSFIADKYLWGPHESFMHLENLLLHGACVLLVFSITSLLAERYGLTSPYLPMCAALLFGLHPLVCEPVNWISGRTDLLAGFFLLTAMWLLMKFLKQESVLLLGGVAGAFFLATLAKETALFWFPSALFAVFCGRREQRDCPKSWFSFSAIKPYLLISFVPVAYFTMRYLAYRREDGGVNLAVQGMVAGQYDVLNKLRIILKVFGFYLKKLIFPFPLNFAIISVSNWYVPVGIAGLLLCCYLLYRRSLLGTLLLMASCIISPALLVPLGRMAWTPVAERYLYMPVAFVVMFLVVGCALLAVRTHFPRGVLFILVSFLLAGSCYATYHRNVVWHTNKDLFLDCTKKSPDFVPARNELARALLSKGNVDAANRIFLENRVSSTEKFRIVTEINRANILASRHDVEGGIAVLEQLHYDKSQPMYDVYLKSMLTLYGQLGAKEQNAGRRRQLQLKEIDLMKELQAYTGDPYSLYHIGKLYMGVNDMQNAIRYFNLTVERAPEKAFYRDPARRLAERLSREHGYRP